jgi:Cu2+-containing amine oxidase
VDVVAMPPGPDNPYGNGFKAVETPLTTVHQAQRTADPFKVRQCAPPALLYLPRDMLPPAAA